MNTIKHIIIISALLQASLAVSQTVKNYDPQTNTYYPGCGSTNRISRFENTNMAPALFNWQMVQTSTIQIMKSIQFLDSLNGYVSYYQGLMKSTNAGGNWQEIYYSPGSEMNGINFLNKDTGWYVGGGRIRKTINAGLDWIIQDYPPFGTTPNYYSVIFFNNNYGIVTGIRDKGYIIKTTNSGANWQQIFLSTQNNTDIYGQFWFNKDTGWVFGNSIFMTTTNGGSTFQDYYPNLPPTSNGSNALLGLCFINDQTGWLSGSNVDHKNMYKTTNGGVNWVFQDNPVAQSQFAQLDDVLFIDENRGWAGGFSGQIITTTNGGVNWINDITAATWFVCFENYGSSKAWCGANNGEVWYLDDIPPLSLNQNGNEVPVTFELKQNYPNPFNPATIIKYEMFQHSVTSLMIYNSAGEEVYRIVSGFRAPGVYELKWDGRDNYGNILPSGVYFYKLETEKYSESKKMVLVR